MPGGRRIIYIKNPKSGSHFRNIGGGGGGGGSSGSGSTPSQPPSGSNVPTWNGTEWSGQGDEATSIPTWNQAIYSDTPSDWAIGGSGIGTSGIPEYGGPGNVWEGQYTAPTFEEFVPSETLWGMIYDIATGVDPYTGDYQPALGTPGTLIFNPLGYDLTYEGMGRGGAGKYGTRYGGVASTSGPRPLNRKRPWFLNTNRNDLGIFKSPFSRKK
jgi:hypothetical protein